MKYGGYVECVKNTVNNLRFKRDELNNDLNKLQLNPMSKGVLINARNETEAELKEMNKRAAQQFTQDEIKYIFG